MKFKMESLFAAATLMAGLSVLSPAAQAAITVTDTPETINEQGKVALMVQVIDCGGRDDLHAGKEVFSFVEDKEVVQLKAKTADNKETVSTYLLPTVEGDEINLLVYTKMAYNKSVYTYYRLKKSETATINLGHRLEDGRKVWLLVTPHTVTDDINY